MSRLNELITELCPDGVEYRKLGSFCDCFSGATPKKSNPTYWEGGTIPWMSSGEIHQHVVTHVDGRITQAGFDSCSTRMIPAGTVLVALAGQGKTRGTAAITAIELCTNQSIGAIQCDETVESRYLYYYLSGQYEYLRRISSGEGTRGGLNMPLLRDFDIPVPPIEVQREIVRILDSFQELDDALTAEIEAREKQKETYIEVWLDSKAYTFKTMGDIAIIHDGKRKPIKKSNRISGKYPYYGASGIVDYVNDYIFDGDFLLLSEDGANLVTRNLPIAFSISGKTWVNNHAHVLQFESIAMQRVAEAYLNRTDLTSVLSLAAQPKLTQASLRKLQIPVPSQSDLDSFSQSLHCLEHMVELLASERDARRKQFAYYRDQLLAFSEKVTA